MPIPLYTIQYNKPLFKVGNNQTIIIRALL